MRILMVLLLGMSLLGGCAKSPSSAGLQHMGAQDAYARGKAEKAEAVVPFQHNGSAILSLQQCVSIALQHNPELKAVADDATVAQAKLDGSRAVIWPKVSVVGGYTHYKDAVRLVQARKAGEPALYTDDVLSGDLVVTLPIFAGGKNYNQILASDLLLLSAEKKLAYTREELIYNVTSLYLASVAQKQVVAALDRSKADLEAQANRIRQMIAAEKAAKVDLLRADVRVAEVAQQRIAEHNVYVTTRLALINMMGIDLAEEHLVLAETLQPPPEHDAETIPPLATVLERRKDYQSALHSLEAQGKMVSVARSGFWPEVFVKGSYGQRRAVGAVDNAGADTHGELGNVGVFFEFPLFEGGATLAKVREETARQSAARHRLIKLEKQIKLELQTAELNKRSAAARINAARLGQEQARESFRIERMKYDLGKGTILDTLAAEAALLQVDVAYSRALADYHRAIAQLRLVAGGE